jgi:two-component system response regulator LytT
MSKVKILVVEDELIIAEDIRMMLEELGYEVVGIAQNYNEAVSILDHQDPDIVLIDIVLPGQKDGIDLAHIIKEEYRLPLIFITSHSDKATVERAKQVRPDGYLLKPFEKHDLYTSIEIAVYNFVYKNDQKEKYSDIKENNYFLKDSIFIRKDYLLIKIRFDELKWIKSEGNYLELHCKDKKHLIRSSLKDFIHKLPETQFLQIHKSYSVNINFVDAINHKYIRIHESKIPIGRAFYEKVMKKLDVPL